MGVKRQQYVGDFETTTDPHDVRVWASCLVNIDTLETDFIGNDIESFFKFLENKNSVVYFHNEKFDGEFVLSYLLSNGYEYNNTHEAKTFETLITDDGIFYTITVYFSKFKKRYKKVVFYDSLKKLPFKVATISKAFELEDEKLEIDYKAHRPVGHVLTEQEKRYIVNDCRIVAQALQIQFSKGLVKMTNASDAMNNYKESINGLFEKWFPVFTFELDKDIRAAYKGGWTYLQERYRNRRIKSGLVFDVNSLYPWAMYSCLLPFGYPVYFEGEPSPSERYPLFIVRLKCAFEIKPDRLPTIQLKGNRWFVETEYLKSSGKLPNGGMRIVEMTLTSVDLALFLEHYDTYNLEYICGWKFKGAKGMFKQYIDYWMNIKETTTGAMRQLAKLMLNSLYGRFALNPKTRKKIPELDENGVVKYKRGEVEYRDPVYTAMGCFITAYAREKTIRTAQTVYDRFIYADTDSLHIEGTELPDIDIHPTHLGAWKHEGTFCDSKYLRAKTYMETMLEYKPDTLRNYATMLNDTFDILRTGKGIQYKETKVTCAGMPENVKKDVTYENFKSGSTFDGKLLPKRCKGGVVLIDTQFTIK